MIRIKAYKAAFLLSKSVFLCNHTMHPLFFAGCEYGAIRLADGGTNLEGRVEICFHNIWGTICNRDWNTADARVTCRDLGFSSSGM